MIFGSSRPLFGSVNVVESALMTKTETWRTERPWSHRKRHQPARAFNYHSRQVPDMDTVISAPGHLVMHPALANRVREQLALPGDAASVPDLVRSMPAPLEQPSRPYSSFLTSSPFAIREPRAFINAGISIR